MNDTNAIPAAPYRPLPPEAEALCEQAGASPRLVAHLVLVHDVAATLVERLTTAFPDLPLDRNAILFGSATHDIGKTQFPMELSQPGQQHEAAGVEILMSYGVPEARARFATTHANWQELNPPQIEDLLVALADKCWKGKRVDELESVVVSLIADQSKLEAWECYSMVDEILQELASDADERLSWQMSFPVK